ncbi:MAG: hypothetical protein HFG71_01625 [Hungatella sp.]|nr:hypothetical protein [Hungatella sp.]
MKRNLCISIILFIVLVMILWLGYWIFGFNPFNLHEYCRYDSGLYLSIAERGYVIEPKWSDGWNAYVYEGNCGWYYLYPMLIKVLNIVTGFDNMLLGVIISFLFTFTLIYLSLKLMDDYENKYMILAALVTFPGWAWLFSIFPMSMTVFFLTANIYYLHKDKYILCGLFGFLASASYSTAFLICLVDFIYMIYTYIIERKFDPKLFVKNSLMTSGMTVLGFISFHIILFLKTGYCNAFF